MVEVDDVVSLNSIVVMLKAAVVTAVVPASACPSGCSGILLLSCPLAQVNTRNVREVARPARLRRGKAARQRTVGARALSDILVDVAATVA